MPPHQTSPCPVLSTFSRKAAFSALCHTSSLTNSTPSSFSTFPTSGRLAWQWSHSVPVNMISLPWLSATGIGSHLGKGRKGLYLKVFLWGGRKCTEQSLLPSAKEWRAPIAPVG